MVPYGRPTGQNVDNSPEAQKNLQFKEVFRMGSDEQRDGADRQETGDESACFSKLLIRTAIPGNGSTILDLAPVDQESKSLWLLLAEDGQLLWHDADSGESEVVARLRLPSESARGPFAGHTLAQRLHVSHDGDFAAPSSWTAGTMNRKRCRSHSALPHGKDVWSRSIAHLGTD